MDKGNYLHNAVGRVNGAQGIEGQGPPCGGQGRQSEGNGLAMRFGWWAVPVHPLLFAAHPVLFLYANNSAAFAFAQILRPLGFSVGLTAAALVLLRIFMRDWVRAAVVVSVGVTLIFQYGRIHEAITSVLGFGASVAWLGIAAAMGIGAIRVRYNPTAVTCFLNVVGVVLVIMVVANVAAAELGKLNYGAGTASGAGGSANAQEMQVTLAPRVHPLPDIYYIILDGYGRPDVIKETYGVDVSGLAEYLRMRGFYVVPKARANYAQTLLSLASSLNMAYLNYLGSEVGTRRNDRSPLLRLIEKNRVCALLKSVGYTVVTYPSICGEVLGPFPEDFAVDEYENAQREFALEVVQMTPFRTLEFASAMRESVAPLTLLAQHRKNVLYTLDHLGRLRGIRRPVFVFAHIMCPHPPFTFDRNGGLRRKESFLWGDGDHIQRSFEEYREGYIEQVYFINQRMREMVDRILSNSPTPPVIIIQGDHGPGGRTHWNDPRNSDLRERLSILNAYYLPGGAEKLLGEETSPVNSFRIVFDYYFGAKLDILPDVSYFSCWDTPYDFIRYEPLERASVVRLARGQ